jgi:peptidyl-prolyl cis-trans isomerase SurA
MKMRIVLLAILALNFFSAFAQDNVVDEVVWVVGDEPILRSDVEAARIEAQSDGTKFNGDPYCVIPEQLAIQKLYLHQADLDSIVVSDKDVISAVDRRINRMVEYYGSQEKLEEYVRMPLSKYREKTRDLERDHEIIEKEQRSIVGDIPVSPSDVRQYLKTLPIDSIPTIGAKTEVEIITIEPQFTNAEIEGIKDQLREFTDRVNKGESFSTLARMYSEDGSAKVGGELGFMGKGELDPEFANVAFSLSDPKKVSKVVETEYGFHIIQLIEKRGDRINCRHILLKPKISASEINQAMLRLDSIADLIRNQKTSFADAAKFFSYDKETRNNGGLMVNSNTRSGLPVSQFTLEELPQEVGKMAYKLNVGEISEPFRMISKEKGKDVCSIIRVKSKIKEHKASVTEDFQQLREIVQEKKSEKILRDWIIEKQKKIDVRISDNWKNCAFEYPGWIKK